MKSLGDRAILTQGFVAARSCSDGYTPLAAVAAVGNYEIGSSRTPVQHSSLASSACGFRRGGRECQHTLLRGLPLPKATMFAVISLSSRCRAARLAQAICGVTIKRGELQ